MVIAEAMKRSSSQREKTEFFFYRTASGIEVDLIMERGNEFEAYEIKFAKTLSREMARPLASFSAEHRVRKASILSLQEKKTAPAEGIFAEPWHALGE